MTISDLIREEIERQESEDSEDTGFNQEEFDSLFTTDETFEQFLVSIGHGEE